MTLQPPAMVINGRFATQSLSGVQRFAGEICRALTRVYPQGTPLPPLLAPKGNLTEADGFGLPLKQFGRVGGQAWEQLELPLHVRGKLLVNLGNTAPLLVRRQLVVLHDAAVFAQPQGYSWKFRLWYKFLQNVLSRTPARLLTVSNFSRRELARYLHVKESRIGVIPEGGEHITRVPADRSVLARNGLEGTPFVLAVGNLAPHKNLRALNVLAHELHQRGVPLVISGGANPSVFGGEAVLPQPALYVGRVTDAELHALYDAASCFVFPSLYEGFGLPAVEAMSCGCPVVASSIPPFQEICADAALYADPHYPADISSRVMQVLDSADEAARLKAAGLRRAATYSWDNAARALIAQAELAVRA